MNAIRVSHQAKLIAVGIPIMLLLAAIIVSKSKHFSSLDSSFHIGLTLDLIVTIPLVYYILIRKLDIPKYTVLTASVICLLAASFIIPTAHQGFLLKVRGFAIPILEVLLLGIIYIKVRKTIQSFKNNNDNGLDFYDAILAATSELFPKTPAKLLSSEIAMIYYLFNWKTNNIPNPYEFTYHKKSGITLILSTLIGVAAMELFVVHILLEKWSSTAAWIATGLTGYSFLQIIALMRSMKKRPSYIDLENGIIKLRYGYFASADIDIASIEKIRFTSRTMPESENMKQLSPLRLLDSHNVIFYLKENTLVNNLYAKAKKVRVLGVFFDDKEKLKSILLSINSSIRFS